MIDGRPQITVAVQCHNFQRRLCWMLSSLRGQGVAVDVAHLYGNGSPTTEQVAAAFDWRGVSVALSTYDALAAFERRGVVRTFQIQRCRTEWILFADSDMVYHPEFFARLAEHLEPGFTGMLIAGRMSQPNETIDNTNATVNAHQYPAAIPNAFDQASRLPLVRRACVGAGFFQLVRLPACGGYYVHADECRDWRWTGRGQKAKSDMQFRSRIGKQGEIRKLPAWFTENQIHLNHTRDKDAGAHIEEQR